MAGTKYSRSEAKLTDDEDFGCSSKVQLRRFSHILTSPSLITAVAFYIGVLAAFGSIRLFENIGKRDTDWMKPPGDVKVQFEYNDTYPGPPTMESEYAWLDLLPDGLGAVQHDDLSDAIVTILVFHQLHCLMALRHGIYEDWNGTRHSHMTPHHNRHCLEYLRQSIMCNADTNLEYRVVREDGVKETRGCDVKRCRNFDVARKWAQKWRAFDGKIPSTKHVTTDPDILRGRVIDC